VVFFCFADCAGNLQVVRVKQRSEVVMLPCRFNARP
jgi:hypothetical protein